MQNILPKTLRNHNSNDCAKMLIDNGVVFLASNSDSIFNILSYLKRHPEKIFCLKITLRQCDPDFFQRRDQSC